ncbi:MAG: DUF2851 family protein [Terrimicrobiaceae bacterium]
MSAETTLSYDVALGLFGVEESVPPRMPEIEIQARLFNGEFGTHWITTRGAGVEVVHFGEWNREAGPDFRGARLRFSDGSERDGDIEVDVDPRDWENHGHASNPAFAGVLLQLFVHASGPQAFARTLENREVVQARLDINEPRARPLSRIPGTVEREAAVAMIEEAADFRLRQKQTAYSTAVTLHGADTALFHAIAAGLGYKNNSVPFLLLAQRTGIRVAGSASGAARLFGLAGFLEPRTFDAADGVTRDYLKPLWEDWWAVRDGLARLVLPGSVWKLSGLRPSNHPHRRIGALAAVARGFGDLRRAAKRDGIRGFEKFFDGLTDEYWSRHWNLSAARLDRDLALVGADRVRDLVINAWIPSLPLELAREELARRTGPTASGKVLRACEWLIGGTDARLFKTALHQQGLLQLYSDFGSLTPIEAWVRIRSGGGQST